ncbi:hypothetical protein Cni_G07441 [Canna indica]|uniref:Senescence regulator n=1 Tax=Canna indica TaxID=4628 RepID=A0AAQ3K0D2_9LILI|nr:hypothetical protein Cni_G07441 [Canna indica]
MLSIYKGALEWGQSEERPPMGEKAASAFHNPADSCLSLREQPPDSVQDDFPTHHLELEESEVIWSDVASNDLFSSSSSSSSLSTIADEYGGSFNHFSSRSADLRRRPSLPLYPSSPSGLLRRPFPLERCGLSTILQAEDDQVALVRQRRLEASAAPRMTVPARKTGGVTEHGIVGQHQSAPMNIPAWPRRRKERKAKAVDAMEGDERSDWENDEEKAEEEMVPPHVMVARSQAMAFSVFEGVGRTLKGRDLRRVRNAVLQKTGFLDS